MNYSENARLYVTGSKDGDVKVWDGISNRCIETFQRAHDGAQICSATFTRNGKVNFACFNFFPGLPFQTERPGKKKKKQISLTVYLFFLGYKVIS